MAPRKLVEINIFSEVQECRFIKKKKSTATNGVEKKSKNMTGKVKEQKPEATATTIKQKVKNNNSPNKCDLYNEEKLKKMLVKLYKK